DFEYDDVQPFFDECRQRNIQIVFTSLPYDGYDPQFGRRVANRLGRPYVEVAPDGIQLVWDGVHMAGGGRALFSRRLADRLAEPDVNIFDCIAQVRSGVQDRVQVAQRTPRAGRAKPESDIRLTTFEEPIATTPREKGKR